MPEAGFQHLLQTSVSGKLDKREPTQASLVETITAS